MNEDLTRVDLFYLEAQVNYWLRFGDFIFEKNIDRRRDFVWFKPDQMFCYIRWWANAHGTRNWTLAILRSCLGHKSDMQSYLGINPGAKILLRVKGAPYVRIILEAFDEIEELDINLCEVSPDYYRYLGQCLTARKTFHPYTIEQHMAFLKEQEFGL